MTRRPLQRPSRRLFLGGAGVAVSLPAFESLRIGGRPAFAQGAGGRKQRILTIFLADGALMDEWTPKQTGANFELPPHLTPLAKVKSKIMVVSGLSNLPGKPDNGTGDHACGTAAAFTCAVPQRGDGPKIKNGVSVDQAAAETLRQNTRISSLQLGLEDGATSGDCEFGFSCVYENCISWANEKQALPKTVSPGQAFDQVFAGFDPTASAKVKADRLARKASVLDYVRGEATSLSAKLGATDRAKLDQMLSAVRDLEKQIQSDSTMGANPAPAACASPGMRPVGGVGIDLPTRAMMMNGLITTAFQCDVTRVVSHMLGHAYPSRPYSFLGVNAKHHDVSHYFDDAAKDEYRRIVAWNMGVVADLLNRLDAIPDGDGATVLDNTMVILTSDCGESRTHDHTHLPMLLAGGAGVFKMGRHVAAPGKTVSSLFISVLNALGVPATTFGADGKAPLSGLT